MLVTTERSFLHVSNCIYALLFCPGCIDFSNIVIEILIPTFSPTFQVVMSSGGVLLTYAIAILTNSLRPPQIPLTVIASDNSRRMHAVCAEPGINSRRHITVVKPFQSIIVSLHTHKLNNDVFLSYDCKLLFGSSPPHHGGHLRG